MQNINQVAPATFSFESHNVRVITDGKHPLFVARDVALALGYKDPTNAIKQFCKGVVKHHPLQTEGGLQKIRVFSLRGAHLLGMLARTKKAKEFRRWVLDIIEQHRHDAGILTTEYHQALATLALAQETASLHGRGLNLWRQRKTGLRERVQSLLARMQPDMFISAR